MSQRDVLKDPNKELRKTSSFVEPDLILNDEIQTLIKDLKETMTVENGVGLAAPQVGVHKRVVIIDAGQGPQAFVNPEITSRSFRKVESEEGCLSIPGVFGIVKRSKRIELSAYTEDGELISMKADGFPAIVQQHEIDHLDGILFIDKVTRYTSAPRM